MVIAPVQGRCGFKFQFKFNSPHLCRRGIVVAEWLWCRFLEVVGLNSSSNSVTPHLFSLGIVVVEWLWRQFWEIVCVNSSSNKSPLPPISVVTW